MNVKKSSNLDDPMRGMKRMVFAMGIVLIAGVVVLIYAGFRKIEREKTHINVDKKYISASCKQP